MSLFEHFTAARFAVACALLVTIMNFATFMVFHSSPDTPSRHLIEEGDDVDGLRAANKRRLGHNVIKEEQELLVYETLPPEWKFPGAPFMVNGVDETTGKPTFPIFELTYDDKQRYVTTFFVPDGMYVQGPFAKCSRDEESKQSYYSDFFSRQVDVTKKFKFSWGIKIGLVKIGGSMSKSESVSTYRSYYDQGYRHSINVEAESVIYRAEYRTLPRLAPKFQALKTALGPNPSVAQLVDFIKMFGTHFTRSARFGGRMSQSYFFTESHKKTEGIDKISKSASAGFSFMGFGVSGTKASTSQFNTAEEQYNSITRTSVSFEGGEAKEDWQDWCSTVTKIPIVLEAETEELSTLLDASQRTNWHAARGRYVWCNANGDFLENERRCRCDPGWLGTSCEEEDFAYIPPEVLAAMPVASADQIGDTYVSWGVADCGPKDVMLYQGWAAGAHHSHAGSGANLLCVPPEQARSDSYSPRDENGGILYGTEWRTNGYGVASLKHLNKYSLGCAVCATSGRKVFDHPGRRDCPAGSELIAKGFLFSSHYHHYRSSFVCVNAVSQQVGSSHDYADSLYYPVEYRNAKLHPTFRDHVEGTCAICSQPSSAPLYTRWGRTTCGHGEHKLYKGWMAGSKHDHRGSGVNYLCMADEANEYGSDTGNQAAGLLYPVGYKTSSGQISSFAHKHDYEAPCSVCQVKDRPGRAVYMQVGKQHCPTNFHRSYWGYVMASHYTHQKSEFICVDSHAETIGTREGTSRGLLYPTEVQHNGVPGYVHDREITCSVCTTQEVGQVYTNWGSQKCPSTAEKVYEGMVGASYHGHVGGGYNYLCMQDNPEYGEHNNGNQDGALIYRMEYFLSGHGLGRLLHLDRQEVPCSLCMRKNAIATRMIPGVQECPPGWRLDYAGYLFSNHYVHQKGEHVCVTRDAEGHGSSRHHTHHGLMYPVETGENLPKWREHEEIGCAVCSQM
eukprot:GFYU01002467.1.p1 GENE.GFYU01002467.1~~GFYU01002467.1.p1  ORF type:complete len:957 (-),score=279.64 GFYU01002467.1:133-3003(-)